MARVEFKRNPAGIATLLKSPRLAGVIRAKAAQVDSNLQGQGHNVETKVDSYVTDRVASSVTILDPRGKALQVKEGALTRAAAAAGLEVNSK